MTIIAAMLESEMKSRLALSYYPKQSPSGLPTSSNKWGIKGTATIKCIYGTFQKDFSSERMLTVNSDLSWEKLRNQL